VAIGGHAPANSRFLCGIKPLRFNVPVAAFTLIHAQQSWGKSTGCVFNRRMVYRDQKPMKMSMSLPGYGPGPKRPRERAKRSGRWPRTQAHGGQSGVKTGRAGTGRSAPAARILYSQRARLCQSVSRCCVIPQGYRANLMNVHRPKTARFPRMISEPYSYMFVYCFLTLVYCPLTLWKHSTRLLASSVDVCPNRKLLCDRSVTKHNFLKSFRNFFHFSCLSNDFKRLASNSDFLEWFQLLTRIVKVCEAGCFWHALCRN